MSSVIPGYEYDIFISYRQKDNKQHGWVTEFINNLKGELESTFKDEISVYFDINPHDGLLETHDISASLREKLKCLIFIPIISQTYCDSRCFAWQNEFVAFNKMAKEEELGKDIRLASGNIASRILPVRIHDLDEEDKELLENELGGPIRSIDFIYKSPGVNRPLRANEDHPSDNLNKTYYNDQINKVANAVKEIIAGMKNQDKRVIKVQEDVGKGRTKQISRKPKIILVSFFVIALLVFGYLLIPKISGNNDTVDKSIAVLPFRNLSNDTTQSTFCDGFMEDILNDLQKVKSFTVRPRTSSYQYKDTKKSTGLIGKELNVNYLVGGSVGREGNNLKIRVSLIDSKADKQVWSNDYVREVKQLFSLQTEIAEQIANELKSELTPEEIKTIEKRPTENIEAYNYFLQGNYYYWRASGSGDNNAAIELYEKAIGLDPRFAQAYAGIARCYLDQYWLYKNHTEDAVNKSKQAIDKSFDIDPDLPDAYIALGIYYYYGFLKYDEALKQFGIVLKNQPMNPDAIYYSACVNRRAGNWEMARSGFEKAMELNPGIAEVVEDAAETYDLLRNYPKSEKYYNQCIMLQPDWIFPYPNLARMILKGEGDTKKAREILRTAALNNKNSISDSMFIETNVIIDVYEGKYEEALKDLSLLKYDVIQSQFYFRPKYLYNAIIYGLMNKPELEHAYFDSTRLFLEKKIIDSPDDQRLYSSLGIAYAGLDNYDKAISAGEKAVKLLPVSKEAFRGVVLMEDLALIYVMAGKYDNALRQLKYLLSIPGYLSTNILKLDPRYAPIRNLPEFKKMMESNTGK